MKFYVFATLYETTQIAFRLWAVFAIFFVPFFFTFAKHFYQYLLIFLFCKDTVLFYINITQLHFYIFLTFFVYGKKHKRQIINVFRF